MKRKLLILFVGVKSKDPSYLAKALVKDIVSLQQGGRNVI